MEKFSVPIPGSTITLIPATPEHKPLCFEWATNSDATPFWYGERYGDEIPDEAAFFDDWKDHYFDEEKPEPFTPPPSVYRQFPGTTASL